MKNLAPITLLLALAFTASCQKIEIDPDYMVGKWTLTFEDERIANDGLTWYTFSADGTCQKKVYNALAAEGEDTYYYSGTWSISENDLGTKFLTIDYNSLFGGDSFIISKKSANSLNIYSYGLALEVNQRYILKRSN